MSERFTALFALMLRTFFLAVLTLATAGAHAEDEYLPPEQAFKFSASMKDAGTIAVRFDIADGYYMYRERFGFTAEGASLGTPQLPSGKVKFDETFQKDVETYRKAVTVLLPVEAGGIFKLNVASQGCADKGLCYAPMASLAELDVRAVPSSGTSAGVNVPVSEMGRIEAALKSGSLLAIVPLFLILGLGLAFTPCVLPMVPILSSIIVGEGAQAGRKRAFILSLAYSLGMALVYTALGVAAGLIGEGLAAALQKPPILIGFAVLMLAFALAMFDVYQMQMPAFIQTRLLQASEKQAHGKLLGVFAMGALSALIVGPCVAAPLAGALIYISQTRDVLVGGGALFAMAAGMSIPLLLVGISAGTLLPRAGAWMAEVKRFFGVLMLAMALWMVSPLLPGNLQMLGWALLAGAYGAFLLWSRRAGWLAKACGLAFALVGALQLTGVATGASDPLAPLAKLRGNEVRHVEFMRVKSLAELETAVAQARGKTVLFDFYADWCVSCKEMEKFTFTDPRIQAQMGQMVLLQADVTANNEDDKALLKRFKLFGPPGIVFFDKQGREIPGGRVIGFQNAERFLQSLERVNPI
ncbi:protein-disulfide reductase DsbD [Noviherbaspirillum sedimenti]|uniref:Thiol:disulfide interchange protein DsbD n=1 Tax=Noviherbaspirillum sedimenti TaxID=2320865 RepID=A0A3A3G731_9BURK|nr:protein-disulfide reductase DsbD [Noviherbaspirillum sedimenti]RJG02362.1 protein-disulfide reductase DsbD [Noviherbaspirillum sedimenti]